MRSMVPAVSKGTWKSRLIPQPIASIRKEVSIERQPSVRPHFRFELKRSPIRFLGLGLLLWAAVVGGARADKIDDYVTTQMSRQHIPGLSLAVVKDGRPVKLKGYGVSNLELGTRATPETVYQIGSLSKQFIAAGVVLLSKEGKLGLDDSIAQYLEGAPEAWQPITVRHALTHTGGLRNESPDFDPRKPKSDVELIKAAYSLPLDFTPGEKWVYSNLGYYVLAEIIHRVTKTPWPQYLQERIFAPLGMNATRPTTTEDLVANRADGYEWADGQYRNGSILFGIRPSGAFLSTVRDLAKWDAALYSDTLFTQQERERLWTPVQLIDGSQKPYGFGWRVEKVGTHRQVHHAGTLSGFRSQMARFVDDRLSVVVLTNSGQALPEQIALGVAAFYIEGLLPQRKAVKLSADALDAYTGQYQVTNGPVLDVSRSEGKLQLTRLAAGTTMELGLLTPESNSRFFNEDDPRSTYVFSMDPQGKVQLKIENEDGQVIQTTSRVDSQH